MKAQTSLMAAIICLLLGNICYNIQGTLEKMRLRNELVEAKAKLRKFEAPKIIDLPEEIYIAKTTDEIEIYRVTQDTVYIGFKAHRPGFSKELDY